MWCSGKSYSLLQFLPCLRRANLLLSPLLLVLSLPVELFSNALISFWGAWVTKKDIPGNFVIVLYLEKEWIVNVHHLKDSHRENWSFVNVFNYNCLHWIEPIEHNERKKGCRCGGRHKPGRGIGRGFQPGPCGNQLLAAPSNEKSLHVINSSDQKPALFFQVIRKHGSWWDPWKMPRGQWLNQAI